MEAIDNILIFLLKIVWYILPAAFANMMPVVMRKTFLLLAKPIDGGRTLGGKPIFGSHKTWRGLMVAVVISTIVFVLQQFFYRFHPIQELSILDYSQYPIYLGTLMGLGAIVGDLIKSFFKRRVGIKPGDSWIPLDQIDFGLGMILFTFFIYTPSWKVILGVVVISLIGSPFMNLLGYNLRIKKKRL